MPKIKVCNEWCSRCETENEYTVIPQEVNFTVKCKTCGRELMLCDECLHSKDNPEGKCDFYKVNNQNCCFRKKVQL